MRLRSPHAHARIRSIDTRPPAKAAPGVLAVLTGADWGRRSGWGDLPTAYRATSM